MTTHSQYFKARHADYRPDGTPVYALMPSIACLDSFPEFPYAQHIHYTLGALPLYATPYQCCDAVCPDDPTGQPCYDGHADCKVKLDCYPGGITRRIDIYLTNVDTCHSAAGKRATLCYDDGLGYWTGAVGLRGGSLNLTFRCNPGDPGDPGKFSLDGYCGSPGIEVFSLSAGYSCSNPLVIAFGQVQLPICCDCPISAPPGPPITDAAAEVAFYAVANCHNYVWAQHVDYKSDGTPIFSTDKPCVWDPGPAATCFMKCGVIATITDISTGTHDCTCMDGTYDLDYTTGAEWDYAGGFSCPGGSPGEIHMSCVYIGLVDGVPTIRLCLFVLCGVDGFGGSACVDIPAEDLEDLDVTFEFDVTGTIIHCGGNCSYQWIEMLNAWDFDGGACDPPCTECGESPINPPPDPVDGQVWTEPCPGDTSNECCTGRIRVRVMR